MRQRSKKLLAWLLVALTATASAQTNAAISFNMPSSHNPFSPYSASEVPEPQLTNSARLTQLIRDGKLYLFEVLARDDAGPIGRGRHKRAVVDANRLEERAAQRSGPG